MLKGKPKGNTRETRKKGNLFCCFPFETSPQCCWTEATRPLKKKNALRICGAPLHGRKPPHGPHPRGPKSSPRRCSRWAPASRRNPTGLLFSGSFSHAGSTPLPGGHLQGTTIFRNPKFEKFPIPVATRLVPLNGLSLCFVLAASQRSIFLCAGYRCEAGESQSKPGSTMVYPEPCFKN